MLVFLGSLQPWRGEPLQHRCDDADVHRRDGTVTLVKVDPYFFEVRHPLSIETQWTAEELLAVGLARAVPFVAPEGKRAVGGVRYERDGGAVREVYDTEDVPPPAEITLTQKLAAAGIAENDLPQLKAWLGISND